MSAAQQELAATNGGELVDHQETDPILLMIQQASRDPDMNVDNLERMFGLYERQQAREAEKAFNRDFIALQQELPEIDEGGKIIHKGKLISKYARWDEDINPTIKPILARHNFTLSFEVDTTDRIRVVAHLIHSDGHSRSSSFTAPPDTSGAKNEVQGMGSAVSYAKRYAAGPLLNLTTKGRDDDGRAAARPQTITRQEADHLDAMAAKVEGGKKRLENYLQQKFGSADPANIPANQYKHVLSIVEANIGGAK